MLHARKLLEGSNGSGDKDNTRAQHLRPISDRAEQSLYLSAFESCGSISGASILSGISTSKHYKWLKEDEEYADDFTSAAEAAVDALEEIARYRAVIGVEEPVGWYKGEPGGYVRKPSDSLLQFLLKGARPHKYATQKHDVKMEVDINTSPIPLDRLSHETKMAIAHDLKAWAEERGLGDRWGDEEIITLGEDEIQSAIPKVIRGASDNIPRDAALDEALASVGSRHNIDINNIRRRVSLRSESFIDGG